MAQNYDLIVIGAGPGGYTAALKAAGFGMKVVVVDEEKLGGVCVNRGCIPTKALLHASNIFATMQHCDVFGVSTDFISFDFTKMQEYKRHSVHQYRRGIEKLFEDNHIEFIKGTATIRRQNTVEVTGEEGREYLKGKYIIIATGARPVIPDIPGIDLQGVSNSDRILAAQNWNYDRVVIMGGGVIGVEFATIFQALCSSVTIVEKGSHLLGPMDTEVALALQNQLEEKGITVLCNSVIEKIEEMGDEDGLACQVTNEKTKETSRIRATQVIVAIGRRPYMDRLLGEDVSLDMEDGRLVVDGDFMTSEKNIYAIGDVITVGDFTGEVVFLGLKTTRIKSWDGKVKIIANHNIDEVINYNMTNSMAIVDFGVSYESNMNKVEKVLQKLAETLTDTLPDLKGEVQVLGIEKLDDSSVVYRMIAPTKSLSHYNVQRIMRKEIKECLDKNNIKIPYPQIEVYHGK